MKTKQKITIAAALLAAAVSASACTDIEEALPAIAENTDPAAQSSGVFSETSQETADNEIYLTDTATEAPVSTNAPDVEIVYDDNDITESSSDTGASEVWSDDDSEIVTLYPPEEEGSADTEDSGESDAPDAPSEIELTFYSITMEKYDSKMPIVTMTPENCRDKSEIWESSDPDIAVVSDKGLITAMSEGECIITVRSAADPGVCASVLVTVSPDPEPTYISGILIANKSYPLPPDYNPGVDPEAEDAFEKMQEAASEEGLNIWIASGFRSYEYQQKLYNRYVEQHGKDEADRFSARAGYSEHQTGLAFDLNTIDDSFGETAEGKWVAEHAHEYGFIIRYPKGKEDITGYMYEPWHLRYLGTETATAVYESGMTLEEFLGITSEYAE
ncbi:MAG: D-alanyl-D-alanine carboxypeptidase family protein [Huintestinicola sp.]